MPHRFSVRHREPSSTEPMKLPTTIVQLGLALLLVTAGWAGQRALSGRDRADRPGREIDPRPLVKTAVVTESIRGLDLQVHGLVVPRRKLLMAAQVAGRVLRRTPNSKSGSSIDRDEVLLQIDPTDLEIEERRLLVERAQIETDLEQSNTQEKGTER